MSTHVPHGNRTSVQDFREQYLLSDFDTVSLSLRHYALPMLPYSQFAPNKVLLKNGSQRVPHRVYGTLGDAYLQNLVINALIEWSLDADARDFNMDRLDGESTSLGDVLSRCANLPFLSDRRVVIVQRAERLDGINRMGDEAGESATTNGANAGAGGKKASKPKAALSPAKRLTEALASLPASTVLILSRTPETPEPGARKAEARCINAAVDKAIESKDDASRGLIIDCTVGAKSGATATAILNSEAARRGIALSASAAEHLVNRAGNNIAGLLNELEKCALRAGEEAVSPSIIDEMVRRAPHDTVFDLTDALGDRQGPRAIAMLRELVGGGEAPELVLALLVRASPAAFAGAHISRCALAARRFARFENAAVSGRATAA
jgi:DNA polymerase-3 subunit delta